MNYLESEFEKFKALVIPEGASHAQVQDMQDAFYAGASKTMMYFMECVEKSEDESEAKIEALHNEIFSYLKARAIALNMGKNPKG